MATVHKGYRLDVELVARIDEWAEAHDMNQADAVRQLLAVALDAGEAEEHHEEAKATANAELRELYGTHIKDLRASVATLTAQISTKDAQIAEKDEQLRRLQDIADHAQMLQAAHVAGRITDGEPVAVEHQETQRRGFWGWVARKLQGTEEA